MKKTITYLVILSSLGALAQSGHVGIGTSSPNNQAILEIKSSDKGVLISRLTTVSRNTLGASLTLAEDGMLVYDKDLTTFYYWDGPNLQWVQVGSGTGDNWGSQIVQTSGANINGDGTSGNPLIVTDGDSDPTNEIELPIGGTSGQVLSTNGSGNYTWINDNGGTDNQDIANLAFDNSTNILTVGIQNGNSQMIDLTSLLNDADSDPTNEIQDLAINTTTNILTITNNGTPTSIDLSPYLDNTDAQTLSLTGNSLSISNGNNVTLTDNVNDADSDPTNEYNTGANLAGTTLTISDGGGNVSVNLNSLLDNTDAQTLSVSGFTITISNGNSITIPNSVPTGAVMAFNLTSCPTGWAPADGTGGVPDLRGEFVRGLDNGRGIDAGRTLATAQGESLVSHNHSINPPATTSTTAGNHNHSIDPPATNSNATGTHAHSIDPPATNTNSTGSHAHVVDPPNTGTTTNGNHRHSQAGYNLVTPGNQIPWYNWSNGTYANNITTTGYAGNHSHTVNIAPFNSNASGTHNHSVNIGTFNSASSGNHLHSINIAPFNSNTTGNHSHSINIAPFNSANSGGSETRPRNVALLYCVKQ